MASPISSCSEDYDAAETFAASLMDQIDTESVGNMVDVQKDMLSRFEKTNEMLINFNILSANRFAITSQQFRRHTQLMYEMKKDLDSIFKRIRVIKDKLGKSYPESFKVCGSSAPILEDEEEIEDDSTTETSQSSQNSVIHQGNDISALVYTTGQNNVVKHKYEPTNTSSINQSKSNVYNGKLVDVSERASKTKIEQKASGNRSKES